jgi:hypothetical protein
VTLELLTESRGQVARRCLREERLRYVDGIVPASISESLRFGTLWHHGMEAWWVAHLPANRDADIALPAAIAHMRNHATPETDEFELARAEVMLEGYDARWADEQYEVFGVELEFRAPLINPETGAKSRTFERGGKVDVLVAHAGRKFIVEHKSSGEDIAPGSSFWSRLRMGGQSAGYIRGAEALGHEVDGLIYDVARKPDLRPLRATPLDQRRYTKEKTKECKSCFTGLKPDSSACEVCGGKGKIITEPSRLYASDREADETVDEYRDRVRAAIAEAPEKYFQRGLVVRLEAQMAEADSEQWQLGQMLREHHRLQLAPRNTDACQRYGNTCSYFAVCAGEASADSHHYRRLDWVHPELSKEL